MRISDWSSDVCSSDLVECANYRIPVSFGELNLSANVSYSSKFTPTTAAFVVRDDPNSGYKNQQGSYATANLSLGWTDPGEHWTASIYGRNVTDTRYKLVDTSNAFADYEEIGRAHV